MSQTLLEGGSEWRELEQHRAAVNGGRRKAAEGPFPLAAHWMAKAVLPV